MLGSRAFTAAAAVVLLGGCAASPTPCPTTAPSSASSPADSPADTLALRDIEVVFHDSGSKKDIERMMSLFADDAVLTVGDKTFTGKEQVRHYFSDVAAPFRPENVLIAYTPAQRIRTAVRGDAATLCFECLWLDTKGQNPPLHTFSDDTLVRSGGRWLVTWATSTGQRSPARRPTGCPSCSAHSALGLRFRRGRRLPWDHRRRPSDLRLPCRRRCFPCS